MKGAGSGRGDGEERDLKSGVVGRGEGSFSPQLFVARFLKTTTSCCSPQRTTTHRDHNTNHNKDMDVNIKGFDTNEHVVEVGADDTVEGLRRKVASAMGLPEDGFCMSFGDEAMGEGADMTQLSAGDTIILTKTKTKKYDAIPELRALGETDLTAQRLSQVKDPVVACLLLQAEVATVIPYGFLSSTSLTRLDLSAESIVTHIGNKFLYACTSLTSVDLSGLSNVTQVGSHFLADCSSLTTLDLSALSNVTQVGHFFLASCTSLTTLDLSPLSRVTSIIADFTGLTFFAAYCTSLTSIYLSGCSSVVSNKVRKGELRHLVVEARPKRSRDESPEESQKRLRHAQ